MWSRPICGGNCPRPLYRTPLTPPVFFARAYPPQGAGGSRLPVDIQRPRRHHRRVAKIDAARSRREMVIPARDAQELRIDREIARARAHAGVVEIRVGPE